MNIGAAVFGGLILIASIGGIFYLVGVSHNTPVQTDTYGQAMNPQSNDSQALASTLTDTGTSNSPVLILLIAVIIICVILFAIYLWTRTVT